MPAINSKPTSEEIDQENHLCNDAVDYLEYLSEIIQSEVDSEDSDDEELSPIVSQFLQDYKEYVSSSNTQLFDSDSSGSSIKYKKRSRLPRRFLKYSESFQSLQSLSPELLCDQKLCETQLDCNAQVSPLFSTFFSSDDDDRRENEKLLTNGTPSVTLLKSQLEKDARIREYNYMIVRSPIYVPEEEKKFVFVVKKSTDVIVAAAPPPVVELPKQEPVKEETVENNNTTIENEKSGAYKEKARMSTINYLVSSFLASAKLGFSGSQINSLVST